MNKEGLYAGMGASLVGVGTYCIHWAIPVVLIGVVFLMYSYALFCDREEKTENDARLAEAESKIEKLKDLAEQTLEKARTQVADYKELLDMYGKLLEKANTILDENNELRGTNNDLQKQNADLMDQVSKLTSEPKAN